MLGDKNYTPSLDKEEKQKMNEFVPLDLAKIMLRKPAACSKHKS